MEQLFADAFGHPLVQFCVGIIGFGIFTRLVMNGLADRLQSKLSKHLTAHLLGPALALVLFGSKVLELPRRGVWGYITALLMGWAGAWAAKGWHHWRKKNA